MALRFARIVRTFPLELGLGGSLRLQAIEVLQKEQPGRLLGVVELGGAARFFAKGVIDTPEGLFEHRRAFPLR